jgi:hypothetical protein
MDPGTAGSVGFLIRLVTLALAAAVALRVAGLNAGTLARCAWSAERSPASSRGSSAPWDSSDGGRLADEVLSAVRNGGGYGARPETDGA